MNAKKLTIGIRPQHRMFRIQSIGGALVDEILGSLKSKGLRESYFSELQRGADGAFLKLTAEDSSVQLHIDTSNLAFTINNYELSSNVNFEKSIKEFKTVFELVNKTLQMTGVRRIGIACEYRTDSAEHQASKLLSESLMKFQPNGHQAKFNLSFEQRTPIKTNIGVPDFRKDDFWNVIESYYDGELDVEYSDTKSINFILDVQRYYSPLLSGKVTDALDDVFRHFQKNEKLFLERLSKFGLGDSKNEKK